jgi:hypothetical protein
VLNADAIHKIARKVILQKLVQGAHGIVVVAGLLIMRIHLIFEGHYVLIMSRKLLVFTEFWIIGTLYISV